jgi:acetyltransferase-like isoleucine patch superfamily enzyme
MTEQEKASRLLDDYIKQLGWSLSKLPAQDREEIIQEVQVHLLDRLETSETVEEFRQTLQEFGPPEEYARSFLENYEVSVALASASPWQILQQNFRMIGRRSSAVLPLLVISFLYILSVCLLLIGLLKPLFPKHIGLWATSNPLTFHFGVNLEPIPSQEVLGYWIIPLAILLGAALFMVTARLSHLHLIAVTKRQDRRIQGLSIVTLLLVLVVCVFAATSVRVISGRDDLYVLEANKTRLGILIVEEEATAIFMENSSWIGLVISKSGELTVEDDVTITGPVYLFADSLKLGENATIRGSVYLFSGELMLEPGASIRRDAVLFAGDLNLSEGAIIRDDVVLFAGDLEIGDGAAVQDDAFLFAGGVDLHEGAMLRGDALLFAGPMQIGHRAAAGGDLILFAGGLELAGDAVLYDDAVLFAGDLHLYPEALVEGDVVVTEGDATLESQSVISGKLYLNPEPGRGYVHKAPSARVIGGIANPDSITAVSGWRTAGFFLQQLLKRILPPVIIILAVVFLVRFRRRRRAH